MALCNTDEDLVVQRISDRWTSTRVVTLSFRLYFGLSFATGVVFANAHTLGFKGIVRVASTIGLALSIHPPGRELLGFHTLTRR